MCLTVPCEVLRVDGETALVRRGDAQLTVSLFLIEEKVVPGDWLAVQAQRHAQALLSAEEAREVLALYAELAERLESDGVAYV